jgi:hypothetical protein
MAFFRNRQINQMTISFDDHKVYRLLIKLFLYKYMLVSILGELLISEDVQATAYSFGIQLQRPQKECRYISYIFRYSFARYTACG